MQTERQDFARPHFFIQTIQNAKLSEKEGRPIFDSVELVRIKKPGDRDDAVLPVKEQTNINGKWVDSTERWPQEYAAFKRGASQATTGTPLEEWPNPKLTAARVMELKALNIFSVEDLSGVPDNTIGKLGMGARELRDQAKAYLDKAGPDQVSAMAAKIAQLEQMVKNLTEPKVSVPASVDFDTSVYTNEARYGEPMKQDKALDECTDAELKAYIKRETGKGVPGKPSRETLLKRAAELAQSKAA